MLNGDVLTDIDVTRPARAARARRGARATLALYPVEDPSAYGLVRLADDGAVTRVRREARARPDRHQQHLRRRRTCSSARCSTLLEHGRAGLDRARRLPAARRRRPLRLRLATATGWTSGRPSATSRRPSTSSRARSRTEVADAHGRRATCASRTASTTRGRIVPSALVESGCRIGDGRADRRPRGARARRHGRRGHDDRARGRDAGRRDRRALHAARLHRRRPACGSATTARSTGMSVLGEGVTLGAGNVVSNGARLFPGVDAARRGAAVLMAALDADRERSPRSTRTGQVGRDPRPRRRTCATRCGAWTPPASRRSTRPAALIVAGMGGSAVGGAARARRARAAADAAAGRSPTATRCRAGPGRRRSCCARATRATPRRRSPAYDDAVARGAPRLVRHDRRRARPSARGATACR